MTNALIGTIQHMRIIEKEDNGWTLENEVGKAFLPDVQDHTFIGEKGQSVEVFLYKGDDEKVTATITLPEIVVGTFGWGVVQEVNPNLGAFVDIGTTVDILLPKGDLPVIEAVWPVPDDSLYLRLKKDGNDRLLAIPAKANEWSDLLVDASEVELNDPVKGRILQPGREGSVLLTEEGYRGFIHYTERQQEPRLGEVVAGRVIEVKDDGTLNISLLPMKHERIAEDAAKILSYIEANDGMIPIGNKSDPELIKNTFGMSKAAFKRAVGRLMKEGKINPEDKRMVQVK